MTTYTTCGIYITSCTDLAGRITRMKQVIETLENSAINAAVGSGEMQEYSLDDGQTKISKVYRSPSEVANALTGLYKLLDQMEARYANQRNGRMVRLVDSKNFTGGRQ